MDDQRRDGGTNSTLRNKEQGTHVTLNEYGDDDGNVTNQASLGNGLGKLYATGCEGLTI